MCVNVDIEAEPIGKMDVALRAESYRAPSLSGQHFTTEEEGASLHEVQTHGALSVLHAGKNRPFTLS